MSNTITPKEYLMQASRIDRRINIKIDQIASLKALSEKATSTFSNMPKGSRNIHSKENIITKILDLELELEQDIIEFLDIKRDIFIRIKAIGNADLEMVLEERYLCLKSWDDIAKVMKCGVDNLYKLHHKALSKFSVPNEDSGDTKLE